MKLLSEEEVEIRRKIFEEKMKHPTNELEEPFVKPNEYTPITINWIPEGETWEQVKDYTKDIISQQGKLVFLAHSKDKIVGKPQMINNIIQRIPLVREVEKTIREKMFDGKMGLKIVTSWKFVDDRYDKRYDGNEIKCLAFDFRVYRLIEDGKEYYVLSQQPLSEEQSELTGMKINLDDLSDLSNNLKIRKITHLFIVKESKSSVITLPQDKLVDFTKELAKDGLDAEGFMEYLFTHSNGNVYRYTKDFDMLRVAQLLSGKYEGYPLHLLKLGPVGTGKTTEAEVLDYKFQESQGILEAGNSRMKVLVPSFKENPINLGYICNCNRVALVDELMKMIGAVVSQSHDSNVSIGSYLGDLNMLLEQKKRMIGSGNSNSTIVHSTAKVCITTNALEGKETLASHLTYVDPTTLSRLLVWVQDEEESELIYKKTNICKSRFSPNTQVSYHTIMEKKGVDYKMCVRGNSNIPILPVENNLINNKENLLENGIPQYTSQPPLPVEIDLEKLRYDFLTVYDSCQTFLSNMDIETVRNIWVADINMAKEPMKQIWKSRGLHHTILILDGLIKFRCLFKDYDNTFTAKQEDYKLLQQITNRMIKNWDTKLKKANWSDDFGY